MIRAAALALGLMAAGCAVASDDDGGSGGWPVDGSYRLVMMDGQPFSGNAILRIKGDQAIGGNAPCNSFSASLRAKPPAMMLGPMMVTRRFCNEMAVERVFLDHLRAVRDTRSEADSLILMAEGRDLLVFQRIAN